jgi:hypothetical protein
MRQKLELWSGGMGEKNNKNLFMSLPTLHLISSISATRNTVSTDTFCHYILNYHADTSCAGKGFTMLGDPVKLVNVCGYSRVLPTVKDVPVGTVCAFWTSDKWYNPTFSSYMNISICLTDWTIHSYARTKYTHMDWWLTTFQSSTTQAVVTRFTIPSQELRSPLF